MPGYELWVHHGESCPQDAVEEEDDDRMHEMVEALIPEIDLDSEDPPTPEVREFFELLKASEEPLHEHTKVTQLAFVT